MEIQEKVKVLGQAAALDCEGPPALTREERKKQAIEHSLYQADWLLRFYEFQMDELPFDEGGNLPLSRDPKLIWAGTNLSQQPLEINRASRRELLRIPGIGPKSADAILAARRQGRICDLSQLRQIGIQTNKAAPFILLNGRRPEYQLQLPGL
jgi:predicted DNA-binding helix-hairpin-helix protein